MSISKTENPYTLVRCGRKISLPKFPERFLGSATRKRWSGRKNGVGKLDSDFAVAIIWICPRCATVYETPELSSEKLWELRNEAIRTFYLRFSYVFKRLVGLRSWYEFTTLFKEGLSLLATTRN